MTPQFHAPASRSRCRSLAISVVALLTMLLATPAGAQELDPNSPPPVRDYIGCGHFESQAAAQDYFDQATLEDPSILDWDGDGIACEDAFLDPDSPPPARDYVSCGHFDSQASAQGTLDSGLLDELGRQSLDGDGDGIACEDAFGSDSSSEAAAQETTAGVTALPSTGSGSQAGTNGDRFMILAGLLVTGGVLLSRQHRLQ